MSGQLITRKDFCFAGGFLMLGIQVAFLAGIIAVFVPSMPALSLAVSAMFILLMSGMVLYQISKIIHGAKPTTCSPADVAAVPGETESR